MDSHSSNKNQHLTVLRDPEYKGVFFTRHLVTIIFLLLLLLLAIIFTVTSHILLDIGIKGSSPQSVLCSDNKNQCYEVVMPAGVYNVIEIGQPAHLKVSVNGSHRQQIVMSTVVEKKRPLSPNSRVQITVQLNSSSSSEDDSEATSIVIIVGKRSALDSIKAWFIGWLQTHL